MSSLTIEAIGFFSAQSQTDVYQSRLSAPRQSGLQRGVSGIITVEKKFREGLKDLEGFDHLWVVFHFHLNQSWKNLVLPPRSPVKRGVFATRSPYRPNPIGLSCVQVKKITPQGIWIEDCDLLDGTPIFDLKPYIKYADSKPKAKLGWIAESEKERFSVRFSKKASTQIEWIEQESQLPFSQTLIEQLEFDPANSKKKRIKKTADNKYIFSYRTWRVMITIQGKKVQVTSVFSGYPKQELLNLQQDPYQDKKIHLHFEEKF